MTEYEQATLTIMKYEHNLSVMARFDSQQEMVAIYGSIYLTLLFGYLVVAYLIGKNLTRVQVSIFNVLYCFSILGSTSIIAGGYAGMAAYWEYSAILVQELGRERVFPMGEGLLSESFIITTMAINLCSLIASLYFMWSIRHPKTE
jgi:hypothetical protein